MNFSTLYDFFFPLLGKIFGIFSFLGTVTYTEFLQIIENFWTTGVLFEFTNVITGAAESISTNVGTSILLSPFILIAQGTTELFGAILTLFNISWDAPLWFVASSYMLVLTTIFGMTSGVVRQFAFKA